MRVHFNTYVLSVQQETEWIVWNVLSAMSSPFYLKRIPKTSLHWWGISSMEYSNSNTVLQLQFFAAFPYERMNTSFCCTHYYPGIFFNDYIFILISSTCVKFCHVWLLIFLICDISSRHCRGLHGGWLTYRTKKNIKIRLILNTYVS